MNTKITLTPLFILLAIWSNNLLSADAETISIAIGDTIKSTTPLIAALWNDQQRKFKWSPHYKKEDCALKAEQFKTLLKKALDEDSLNYVDSQGCTALGSTDNVEYMEALLQAGAKLCPEGLNNVCVLTQQIVSSGGILNNQVKLLIQHAPDTCFKEDGIRSYPLVAAVKGKDTAVFEELLKKRRFTIEDFRAEGCFGTVQSIIVQSGNPQFVKIYNDYLQKIKNT